MEEKKVNKAEEVKEEVKAEENGVELTDEQMAQVSGGNAMPSIEISVVTGGKELTTLP